MQVFLLELGCFSNLVLCSYFVMSDINKGSKRNLPSWMSSKDNDDGENSGKKPILDGDGEKSSEVETSKKKTKVQYENAGKSSASCSESKGFDKLLVLDLINKKQLRIICVFFLNVYCWL